MYILSMQVPYTIRGAGTCRRTEPRLVLSLGATLVRAYDYLYSIIIRIITIIIIIICVTMIITSSSDRA